ncbi:MAG: fibronectin type III domain-containing protein [Nitrospira sp.]|nr:fibronectin type III domain-containing protein [Nitrospira sp.]
MTLDKSFHKSDAIARFVSHAMNCLVTFIITATVLLLSPQSQAWALSTSPSALSFSGTQGDATPPSQTITFWKGNDRTRNWSATSGSPWVTISPSSGTISTERDQLTMSINLTGLSIGTYSTTVVIAIDGLKGHRNLTAIPVTLTVTGTTSATPSMSLSPTALSFSGVAGGTAPAAQLINLTNPTGGTLSWSLSANAAWLNLTQASGTTTTERDSISASVNLTGLTAGTYTAAITATASGTAHTPHVIPVTLTVNSAPTANPVIGLSINSLAFTGTAAGPNPTTQSFTITNTGTGTMPWVVGESASWLTLSPASGTNNGTVLASVNLSGLAAGTYNSTITASATGATSKTLQVTLTINTATATNRSAALSWASNTESDLAGYKVYVGTQSGLYGTSIEVGNVTTHQVTNLQPNTTYFFSITALDTAGNESVHSSELSKSIY